jgi:hypothetical protein
MSATRPDQRIDGTSDVRSAWVWLALSPIFFFLALAAGEGVISACGYPLGDVYPWWVTVLSDGVAVVVVLVPCAGGVVYGLRAHRARVRRSTAPIVTGVIVAVAWIAITVISEVAHSA